MRDKTDPIVFECFTLEQVKNINKKIKEKILKEQNPSDAAAGITKVGSFSNVPCLPLLELLHPWLYQCQIINTEMFGYDINWHFHLDRMNYNVYDLNGEYDWHIDGSDLPKMDVKLTCILNLSEESYEGGKFCTITPNEDIEFSSGRATIFPSMLAHKVTPITKGKRITLSYCATGSAWK